MVESGLRLDKTNLENLRSNIHKNGFDQWGAMFGSIIRSSNEEEEIYYRGIRERILPKKETSNTITRSLTITGISEHGFHFTINQTISDDQL